MLESIRGARVAIVYTEWNDKITTEQNAGAERILNKLECSITHKMAVPGSFELPYACKQLFEATQHSDNAPEAIIAFGAVIRGGTPHFEYVCKAVTEGITLLNTTLPIPVIFGVLTLDNEQQAWERLGGAHGHKGEEAAITALKMIQFNRNLNIK
ncbi:MAG: 6,7-dimethyl-8-ribityllumazine synthase [Chitinophagales bacterium]|nr:6,7-dimethyl-8-ribityllumazine synthase [Chitinophagaceae bacterium]MCB9065921.1 6,7-dimethyl-8-ribityllumazine synthase [Chitinophagales bacterium]